MRSATVLPLSLAVMALLGAVQALPTAAPAGSSHLDKRESYSQVYDTHQDPTSVSVQSVPIHVVQQPGRLAVKREDDDDDDEDDDDDDDDDDEDDDNDQDDSSDDTDNKDDDPNGDPSDDDDNAPTPPPVLTPNSQNSNGLGLFGIIKRSNSPQTKGLQSRSRGGEDGKHGDDDDDDDHRSNHHGQRHRDSGRHGDDEEDRGGDDGGRHGDNDDDDD